jgi:lipopolysaccharide transport system permease protein
VRATREWLGEIWNYRELFYFLAWRDVKVRYKQATLGAAWAVLQPLFGMIVFTVFFGRLAGMSGDGIPYPLSAYCALLPWTFFSVTLAQAGNGLVGNSNLLTKVYFPRVLLPASCALSSLLDFAVGSAFLVVLMAYYRVHPTWALLAFPPLIFALWLLTVGLSMLLAAVNVKYRDVKHVIPFLLQMWLFITPVIYSSSLVPKRLQWLLALNPLSGLIEGFRVAIFPTRSVAPELIASSVVGTILLFVVGAVYFRQTERTFADIV